MSVLRFFMMLSLVVWLGGLIFFAFVVAPSAFSVLPTRHLAGALVTRTLGALHWMGIVSGVVFLGASMGYSYGLRGAAQPGAARHVLIYAMLVLTLVSQFGIMAHMSKLRADMGEIDLIAPTDARRVEFNRLHEWSTRLEGAVLVLGLAAIFALAREWKPKQLVDVK